MRYILDIETNDLKATKLWCIVLKCIETGAITTFTSTSGIAQDFQSFNSFLNQLNPAETTFIGHNIISFDLPILEQLLNCSFDQFGVVDTLVVAKTLNYDIEGGNSLAAWGERLGVHKIEFKKFHEFSQEMLDYCIQDVQVTDKLYALFLPYIESEQHKPALQLEHQTARLCVELHNNGFYFDIDRGLSLHKEICNELQILDQELAIGFPPVEKLIKHIHPRRTKTGAFNRNDFRFLASKELNSLVAVGKGVTTGRYDIQPVNEGIIDLSPFNGEPFDLFEKVPFNPGSPKQCVERLWECGWQPFEKTKGHLQAERIANSRYSSKQERAAALHKLESFKIYGWKINEANLKTLPSTAPEVAHKLVRWLILDSRRSTLEEWFNAYNKNTHRIHGNFNHIGAWTGRMSHTAPNMANIPGHGSVFGDEMRSLWQADPGEYLVGVDADGIQLRIFAHYINDPDFIRSIVSGSKSNNTDAHSLNQRALGPICKDRDTAKTFIYAFLLGAGIGKVAQILGCTASEARDAVEKFLSFYPGLRELKDYAIPADAARGYFIGLDGRVVLCDSEHHMLAGYLQNGEAVIMKTANQIWRNSLKSEGIVFRQCNFVHDEWQNRIVTNDLTVAERAGTLMVQAIEETGALLKLHCPLTGNAKIGRNWLDTH